MGADLMMEAMKAYRKLDLYSMFEASYEISILQDPKGNHFFGHKNERRHLQSYYCSVLYNYIRLELYNPIFKFYGKPEYEIEFKKLKQKYSQRTIYLLIGQLMLESELIFIKRSSDEE